MCQRDFSILTTFATTNTIDKSIKKLCYVKSD